MENEHCAGPDATVPFDTTNGMTTTSATEWEIVTSPKKMADTPSGRYPERKGMREHLP